jgi:hypothetical protein
MGYANSRSARFSNDREGIYGQRGTTADEIDRDAGPNLAAGISQCGRRLALETCAEIESGRAEVCCDIRLASSPANKLTVKVGISPRGGGRIMNFSSTDNFPISRRAK